jgi:predicted outer membrane repeat protein
MSGNGGVVCFSLGTYFLLKNVSFNGNIAQGGKGGAVYSEV